MNQSQSKINFESFKATARDTAEQAFKHDREAYLLQGCKPQAQTALGQLQDLLKELEVHIANLQLDVEED